MNVLRIKAWLILIMGVGMLIIALQGLFTGRLPAGRGGWRQPDGKVCRADQPATFWILFALDAIVGVTCARYGIRHI